MKKYLLILLALTAGMFVSCNKDDSAQRNYVFYEPVMNWNASMSEIRSEMDKKSDWTEDTAQSEENEIIYENKKNRSAQISYEFKGGKMTECSVIYVDCNDSFSQMKEDWAKKLGLTWDGIGVIAGFDTYMSECKSKNCTVQASKGATGNIGIMIMDFTYSK